MQLIFVEGSPQDLPSLPRDCPWQKGIDGACVHCSQLQGTTLEKWMNFVKRVWGMAAVVQQDSPPLHIGSTERKKNRIKKWYELTLFQKQTKAHRYLLVPCSSVESERLLNSVSQSIEEKWNRLTAEKASFLQKEHAAHFLKTALDCMLSLILHDILSTRGWKHSSEILVHGGLIASFTGCGFVSYTSMMQICWQICRLQLQHQMFSLWIQVHWWMGPTLMLDRSISIGGIDLPAVWVNPSGLHPRFLLHTIPAYDIA